MSGHDALTVAVASHGLPTSAAEWPQGPLDHDAWRDLLRAVHRQKLVGMLAACMADGRLPVTDAQYDDVAARHTRAMTGVIRIESRLLDAGQALDDAGVPWRVLKGSAAAHLDYADPAMRVFGDADLLVPGPSIGVAVEALGRIGAHRRRPPLGHGFDQRFAKSVELVDDRDHEFDVHRTLTLEPFGIRIEPEDLFGAVQTFDVGGRRLSALAPHLRLLHAAYHVSLGNFPPRLVPLRDLAALAVRPDVETDLIVDIAGRWWARAVLADAVRRAWDAFALPGGPLIDWARAYQPTRAETRAISAFQRPDRRQAHRTLATLTAMPGLADRVAYLRVMLRPDAAYLASRGMRAGGWLRRGGTALAGRRTP